jgi:hypothetical protein
MFGKTDPMERGVEWDGWLDLQKGKWQENKSCICGQMLLICGQPNIAV